MFFFLLLGDTLGFPLLSCQATGFLLAGLLGSTLPRPHPVLVGLLPVGILTQDLDLCKDRILQVIPTVHHLVDRQGEVQFASLGNQPLNHLAGLGNRGCTTDPAQLVQQLHEGRMHRNLAIGTRPYQPGATRQTQDPEIPQGFHARAGILAQEFQIQGMHLLKDIL